MSLVKRRNTEIFILFFAGDQRGRPDSLVYRNSLSNASVHPYHAPLPSPQNVHKIKTALLKSGFYGQQIVLSDDGGDGDGAATQPTYGNILAALKWLVQGAGRGAW